MFITSLGFGFSLSYSAAIMCLNDYFDKKRSFAILIVVGSSGMGVLAFSFLISFMLEEFALEGTFLILASVCLNTVVGAMLFFPLQRDDIVNGMTSKFFCITMFHVIKS